LKQKTIKKTFSLSGIGIHSGKETSISISPAIENRGILFIKEGKQIKALENNVEETNRGTTLAGIAVVEHLLSAIYGLGIDNLEISVEGDEIPVLDGSALPFALALIGADIIEQREEKQTLPISSPIETSLLKVLPYRGFKVHFVVNFPLVGEQKLSFDLNKDDFVKEIAPARTFGYISEIEQLKKQGLGQGASLENALAIGKEGYLNPPRFPDEVVRHKILDLIGDFSLLGRPLEAEIFANKSGHKNNIEMVRRILKT
jgi:UDP-3-O-acyl N-acetylglucosamine deacetylase